MAMPVIFLKRGQGLANITITKYKYIISLRLLLHFIPCSFTVYSGVLKGIKITYFTLTVSV